MNDTFNERLKQRRKQLNMTQTDLSIAAGLTPSAISRFESATRQPSFDSLRRISAILKVTTDYLLGKRQFGVEDILAD